MNLYQFNGNNPAAYTDPFGLCKDQDRGNCTQAGVGNADLPARGVGGFLATFGTIGSGGSSVTNPVPATLARVVPGNVHPSTLAPAGQADAFVTDATAVRGLNAAQIAQKLSIPESAAGYRVIEFPSNSVQGIASPVNRTNPGFIGGGRTAGGAPEFVVPNGAIPEGATITEVPPMIDEVPIVEFIP